VQADESTSNEAWLIKVADKKTCANLQTSFDFTVMLPSKCHGNNWQRMNRQVLPVKQFHVRDVAYNCEDTRQASARLALLIAVNSPDSNCFARSLPRRLVVRSVRHRGTTDRAESRASHSISNLSIVGTARPFSNHESRTARQVTNPLNLRLGSAPRYSFRSPSGTNRSAAYLQTRFRRHWSSKLLSATSLFTASHA